MDRGVERNPRVLYQVIFVAIASNAEATCSTNFLMCNCGKKFLDLPPGPTEKISEQATTSAKVPISGESMQEKKGINQCLINQKM